MTSPKKLLCPLHQRCQKAKVPEAGTIIIGTTVLKPRANKTDGEVLPRSPFDNSDSEEEEIGGTPM